METKNLPKILSDETRSVEERLFIAQEFILQRDQQIVRLKEEIAKLKSTPANRSDSDLPWEYNRQ